MIPPSMPCARALGFFANTCDAHRDRFVRPNRRIERLIRDSQDNARPNDRIFRGSGRADLSPTSYHGGVRSCVHETFYSWPRRLALFNALGGTRRRHVSDVHRPLYSGRNRPARRGAPALGVRHFPVPTLIAANMHTSTPLCRAILPCVRTCVCVRVFLLS